MQKQITSVIGDIDLKMIKMVSNKKSYLKYRELFQKASNFIERPNNPIHVDIEITNDCNYKCAFCVHGIVSKNSYYKNHKELPKNKIYEILEECAKIGVRSIQFNVINEPLLYENLVDIIQYSNKLGFDDIFFISNGSLLDKDISVKLIEAGLTKLMISVDAFSELDTKDNSDFLDKI